MATSEGRRAVVSQDKRKRLQDIIQEDSKRWEQIRDLLGGENSSFSTHPAAAAQNMSDLFLFRTLTEKKQLAGRALKKIEEGTYGICDVCGKKIDPKRLRVLPETPFCIECQTKKEQEERRVLH